jgi:ubiquinone/menaquinone biosynthesis C-methylase UbiE
MGVDRTRVQEQWTRRADAYTHSPLHRGTEDLRHMVELASPEPTHRVLDLATGGGHTARAFSTAVASVVAFDLTAKMLRNARGLAHEESMSGMEFVQGDVAHLPFREASFDCVTVRAATHHFPDIPGTLLEVLRVLRPGGLLIVNDSIVPDDPEIAEFINRLELLRDPTHVRCYSTSGWEGLLRSVGFEVVHREAWRKHHDFQSWMDLAGMTAEAKKEMEEAVLLAPPGVNEALRVVVDDGRVVAFSDAKGLYIARRP